MKLLFFQYGDFGEAYRRLKDGGLETYRDQRASVEYVSSLQSKYEVTTLALCSRPHDELLDKSLRSVGVDEGATYQTGFIGRLLDDQAPHILVCRTPNYDVIRWARHRGVPTLLTFADFFSNDSPVKFLRNVRLRFLCSASAFPCIANHNLNASISVSQALFYPKSRVVPWDWTRLEVAEVSKAGPAKPDRPSVLFAGALTVEKGVGDCLEAVLS